MQRPLETTRRINRQERPKLDSSHMDRGGGGGKGGHHGASDGVDGGGKCYSWRYGYGVQPARRETASKK